MKKYRLIVDTDTCENINDLSTFYNRTDLDTIIEVDSFTTARDLLIEYRLDTKRPTFLIYDKGENRQVLLENFRFYYNDDILYSYYNPLDVKILDFEKYGYFLNSIIHIRRFEVGNFGGAESFLDFIQEFYDEINRFVIDNPIIYSAVVYFGTKIGKKIIKELSMIINKNLHNYSIFKEGLLFKEVFTLDGFTKAFRLEDLKESYTYEEYWLFVNALLTVYGYQFDTITEKWIRFK